MTRPVAAETDRERARRLLVEAHLHHQLIALWLEVEHYPSWSTRPDFDSQWNFGVREVSGCERGVSLASGRLETINVVRASFAGQRFAIGGRTDFSPLLLDAGASGIETVWFWFNEKLVLVADYERRDSGIIPEHFSVRSIEQMHWSPDWVTFLQDSGRAIHVHHVRRIEKTRREMEQEYEGIRFTRDAPSSRQGPETLGTSRGQPGQVRVRDLSNERGSCRRRVHRPRERRCRCIRGLFAAPPDIGTRRPPRSWRARSVTILAVLSALPVERLWP